MNSTELSKKIAECEALLAKVQGSHSSHAQRIAECERRRQGLFVAARAEGNTDAQKEIRDLAAQIDDAQREQREDAAAIDLISGGLAQLRTDLVLAKKLEARQGLREFIAQYAANKRPARIVELICLLQAELQAWHKDRSEVCAAVRAFDPGLEELAIAVNNLADPVCLDYGALTVSVEEYLGKFSARGAKLFDQVVQALEARLLPGEPVPSDRHAYRARDGAHFGMYGLELRGGETVYLKPEHAADYVKAGLLEEQPVAEEVAVK